MNDDDLLARHPELDAHPRKDWADLSIRLDERDGLRRKAAAEEPTILRLMAVIADSFTMPKPTRRRLAEKLIESGLVQIEIPPENYNQQRIEQTNRLLAELGAEFDAQPWLVTWLNAHEPDLMNRARAALAGEM